MGDYIPMDHDLPDKPEFLQLMRNTGVTNAQLMFALFKLWRLFDRHTCDGKLNGCDFSSLVVSCGQTIEFWQQVAKVGWLEVSAQGLAMPEFRKRFRSSAKERMRQHRRNKRATDAQPSCNGR